MKHSIPDLALGLGLERILRVMQQLRDKEDGCPWDVEQTFETIVPYTIEEAYEVADAIERKDTVDLREELGDLLLQVVYHAQMADERQSFDFADVVEGVTTKMIRRHPHVFGDEKARSAGMAKGAGMIEPNMATMLAFICTDASIGKGEKGVTSRHGSSDHQSKCGQGQYS